MGHDQYGNPQAGRFADIARRSIVDYVCVKDCPIDKPGRIKVSHPELVGECQVKYSDIDLNGHVNSIKYIEHILDLFPMEMFREKRIRRLRWPMWLKVITEIP